MPASFDMPVHALTAYEGVSPRPLDFDAYWAAGLAEMHALGVKVRLAPAAFEVPYARCSHLTFTGVGGAEVHAKLLQPIRFDRAMPAVVFFHPYARGSADWVEYLPYVARGFTVAALDVRGQGGRSHDTASIVGNTLRGHIVRGLDDRPEKLFYRAVFLDTAQLVRVVMALDGVDPERVGVSGMSQGGGLALACAALEPRVRMVAAIAPFLSDYRRVWEIDLARDGYEQLQEYFRRFDPLHEREHEVFERLGYIDVQHLCPRIQAEVLMAVGLMDTICPPSTQYAAFNRIESAKSTLVYPDFGHEMPPGLADRVFAFLGRLDDRAHG